MECNNLNMFFSLLCLLIIASVTSGENESLCDICACVDTDKQNRPFSSLTADCSYRNVTLNSNYSVPKTVNALDFSSTNLVTVDESIYFKSKSIEALYLNDNGIVTIQVNTLLLPELMKLDISNNELEFLDPEVFSHTKKLLYLNLASNKFTRFSTLTFHHLKSLSEIVLDFNNVGSYLKETELFQRNGLALNKAIKKISIRGIQLGKVPENFLLDAYDLRSLDISGNNFTTVPELPFTLEQLDLSDNPIPVLDPEDFSELPAIKVLKLNNLKIKQIKEFLFADLKGLTHLELERNFNLVNFSYLAFGHEALDDPDEFVLESLSLRGSRLTGLDEKLAVPFGQLMELDLQGNPWSCDCKLKWVKQLQIPADYSEHLRCFAPAQFYDAKIFELKAKNFSCPKPKKITGYVIATITFCLLLTVVAMWLYFCLPRYATRGSMLRQTYSPGTVYSVLNLNVNPYEINP